MALTAAQIIVAACKIANCPGFTADGANELNQELQDLAQKYSWVSAEGFVTGTFFNGFSATNNFQGLVANSGPYALPAAFLRFKFNDFFFVNGGINYPLTPLDKDEFDALVQQPGFSTYPTSYCVDDTISPPAFVVWPAPTSAFTWFGRYDIQEADIANAASSGVVPWFPNQTYLQKMLTSRMMGYSGDTRRKEFHDEAIDDLKIYMEKEGNQDTRSVKVKLDPRNFGTNWWTLPRTKAVPW